MLFCYWHYKIYDIGLACCWTLLIKISWFYITVVFRVTTDVFLALYALLDEDCTFLAGRSSMVKSTLWNDFKWVLNKVFLAAKVDMYRWANAKIATGHDYDVFLIIADECQHRKLRGKLGLICNSGSSGVCTHVDAFVFHSYKHEKTKEKIWFPTSVSWRK